MRIARALVLCLLPSLAAAQAVETVHRFELPPYYDSGGALGHMAILVWGSEEQKATLLPPSSPASSARGSCSPSPAPAPTSPPHRRRQFAKATNTS